MGPLTVQLFEAMSVSDKLHALDGVVCIELHSDGRLHKPPSNHDFLHQPFQDCVYLFQSPEGVEVMFVKSERGARYKKVAFVAGILTPTGLRRHPIFDRRSYELTLNEQDGSLSFDVRKRGSDTLQAASKGDELAYIHARTLFGMLEPACAQAYRVKPNPTNKKRIAKGKKPLFDWVTVEIKPQVQRIAESSGEKTGIKHRLHDVRGHWCTVKATGTRYWRNHHKRGDASLGVVFHDYVVKP